MEIVGFKNIQKFKLMLLMQKKISKIKKIVRNNFKIKK
jgi:hypothetical protein